MNKNLKSFLISLFLSIFVFFVYVLFSVLFFWQNKDITHYIANIFIKNTANKNIILVEIDDKTLNNLGYPLSRKYFPQVIDNLNSKKPSIIWIDILFADKSDNLLNDKKMADSFKKAWNIILWYETSWNNKKNIYELFSKNIKSEWYFAPQIASNWKVYSISPFRYLNNNGKIEKNYSFFMAILKEYFTYFYWEENFKENIDWVKYSFFNKSIPLEKWSFFNILFLKNQRNFRHISFIDVYNNNIDVDLKDKIILIWYTVKWLDKFFVPVIWETPWLYIHANAINNVLNDTYIFYFPFLSELIIMFLIIFLLIYSNIYLLRKVNLSWIFWWFFFLFVFFWFIYSLFIFFSWKVILFNSIIWIFIAIFLSFFISIWMKYINEDKNKKKLSKAIREYVSKDIVNEILNWVWSVKLSWENKKITIFFSDIAWFTTISEKLSPEDLVSFLRVYLWKMSDIIIENKWFINKYEWDAIMALWWVFWEVYKYWVIDACKSCILQQRALNLLNEDLLKKWFEPISVRMWLHTWNAIIWNIWSEWKKMEFTALWDSVNLRSRLEWVNKFYGTKICVSENVYNEVKNEFTFRYLDKIRVKWKTIWVNIYELVDFKWEESDLKAFIIKDFKKWISFYLNRNFKEALKIFENLKNLWDGPSIIYFKRCETYLKNPPSEDWDMTWTLDEK